MTANLPVSGRTEPQRRKAEAPPDGPKLPKARKGGWLRCLRRMGRELDRWRREKPPRAEAVTLPDDPKRTPGRRRPTARQLRRELERLQLAETGRPLTGRQWRRLRKADNRDQMAKARERLGLGVAS